MTVAVVGGGIAGLAAARRLVAAGIDTVLVEADPTLGGKIRTLRQDGFLLEAGPESFVTTKPGALALCRSLGLDDELVYARTAAGRTWIYGRGRLRPLPAGVGIAPTRLRPVLTSGLLSPLEKLRLMADLALPARPGAIDESLGRLVRRRFGRAALDRLVAPLAAGIHAADPERLSVAAAFPELWRAAAQGSVLRGLAHGRRGTAPAAPGPFATLRSGLGRLVEQLAEELTVADVRTGARAEALAAHGGGFVLALADGTRIDSEGVVLAIPAPAAARLLARLRPSAARLLAGIRRVSTAVVTLGYRERDVPDPPGNGFVVARDERLPITGGTFSSSKWPGRAPPGRRLARVYLGDAVRPLDLQATDDELVRMARQGLAATVGWRAAPVLERVDRWLDAVPQYDVGHLVRLGAIEDALVDLPGLVLTGSDYRGVGIADCIARGEAAVRRWVGQAVVSHRGRS